MKYLMSTWRFYLAAFFIVGAILAVFSLEPWTAVSGVIIAVVLMLPEVLYLVTPAAKHWARWSDTEGSKSQNVREWRAQNGDVTVKWVDRKFKAAQFVGHSGGKAYRTTLKKCTCPDFQKRGIPCKHMFYLADQLGLLNGGAEDAKEI